MHLSTLVLQHFRSYTQEKFSFSSGLTVIVGPNTAGKTNLTEAIQLLSYGKSFRGQSDQEMIQFEKDVARVQGLVVESVKEKGESSDNEKTKLEVVILSPESNNGRYGKKFLVNGVGKSRNGFVGHLPVVIFRPEELDIVIAGPALRRTFLDVVLEIVDREYYMSHVAYEKAIRQRNALLRIAQESGRKNSQQFSYWDELVIEHGVILHEKRKALIHYLNEIKKDVFEFEIVYDHSIVSEERLRQYQGAEIASGVTLVGPHRDDFFLLVKDKHKQPRDIKTFGSRGQQRLVVLQLKLLQIGFVTEKLGKKPLLVLDDIFSELDTGHIQLVMEKTKGQQVILTTTHQEFLPENHGGSFSMIELNKTNAGI